MADCNGNCGCSTLGPNHDPEARHPNPKACIHAEDLDPRPELDEVIDANVPYPTWRDEDGSIYFTVERK